MECKYRSYKAFLLCFLELIDTLWNVNKADCWCFGFPCQELIDTLWNVNRELKQILGKWNPELIDTLWNVNLEGDAVKD